MVAACTRAALSAAQVQLIYLGAFAAERGLGGSPYLIKSDMPHACRVVQYAHDFAMFLHDCIAYDVKSLAHADLLTVSVKFPDGSPPEIAPRTDENTYDWLERVGRVDVINELNYKVVFHAITADLCNFKLEGLRASAKGKLTGNIALLYQYLGYREQNAITTRQGEHLAASSGGRSLDRPNRHTSLLYACTNLATIHQCWHDAQRSPQSLSRRPRNDGTPRSQARTIARLCAGAAHSGAVERLAAS